MKRLLCIWMSISLFWPLNRIWGQNIRADIEHMTDCDLYSTQYRGNYQNYYRYEIDSTFVKGILISIQKNKESPFCGKHDKNDPVGTDKIDPPKTAKIDPPKTAKIDPPKTVEVDPPKTEQTDPVRVYEIKVVFGRFSRSRILLA